jgi:peptide/nickel transport system permease protein
MFVLLPSADPALLRAGRNPSPEVVAAIRENLGLDKPWYAQYYFYIRDLVLHFDFGYSYQNNIAVRDTIFDRLPATASLALGGAVVWLLIGIPVGIISAIKRGTILDRLAMGGALLAISAPVYWVGLVSIYLFSEDLGKLAPIFKGSGQYTPFTTDPVAWFSALLLPWLVLATAFAAIAGRTVVFKHGLRSAITPIVTIFGLDLGILFGGAILTETVFNIPGVGRLAYDAIQKSDLPIVQGTVLIAAFAVIMMNLIVDIVYAFLDPRVRY